MAPANDAMLAAIKGHVATYKPSAAGSPVTRPLKCRCYRLLKHPVAASWRHDGVRWLTCSKPSNLVTQTRRFITARRLSAPSSQRRDEYDTQLILEVVLLRNNQGAWCRVQVGWTCWISPAARDTRPYPSQGSFLTPASSSQVTMASMMPTYGKAMSDVFWPPLCVESVAALRAKAACRTVPLPFGCRAAAVAQSVARGWVYSPYSQCAGTGMYSADAHSKMVRKEAGTPPHVDDSPFHAADLSPKMVDIVRERIAAVGLGDRIAAQQADAQDLSDFAVRDFHSRLRLTRSTHLLVECRLSTPWV